VRRNFHPGASPTPMPLLTRAMEQVNAMEWWLLTL
jgi:hypothetical protein